MFDIYVSIFWEILRLGCTLQAEYVTRPTFDNCTKIKFNLERHKIQKVL